MTAQQHSSAAERVYLDPDQRLALDTQVRGQAGVTDRTVTVRVTSASPYGWVTGVDAAGAQWVLYAGRFEVTGKPRPEKARTDIPAHLRRDHERR